MLLSKYFKEKFLQASGGPKAIGLEDPEVMEAAKYALKAIDGGSNSNFKHALLKVVEAKVQVITDNLLLYWPSRCRYSRSDDRHFSRTADYFLLRLFIYALIVHLHK